MTNQITIDFDTFESEFDPIYEGETPMRIEPRDWDRYAQDNPVDAVRLSPFLWTEYDDDNLASGWHYVNRLYYWICTVPVNSDEFDIVVNYPSIEEEEQNG